MTAAIILALLQVADAVTTLKALSLWATEANPIMTKLFDRFGEKPVLIVKGVAVSVAGFWLVSEGHDVIAWVLVAFYIAVVINNVRVIRKQKQEVPHHPV